MSRFMTGTLLGRLIAPSVMWSVFLITAALCIIVTVVLWYHWRTYALQTKTMHIARIVYVVGGGVFIALQLIALLSL